VLIAHAVAVVHAAAVVLLLVGGLVALRHPRVLRVHLPVAAAIAAVYLIGADCPLTDLELALRERADGVVYRGGFLAHHVLTPLGIDRDAGTMQAALPLTALLPNLAALVVLARRRRHDDATVARVRGGAQPRG
jgi:hypothetical protein